jgi:hypothetical protein
VTLVSIAMDSMPIQACGAGNVDGDQEIALDEIVTAVNRALRGCATSGVDSLR